MATSPNRARVEGLGWRKQHEDIRDRAFRFAGSAAQIVKPTLAPDFHDMYAGMNDPITDQGSTGSCVGQSGKRVVELLRQYDDDSYSTKYSALDAYYFARWYTQDGSEKIDGGAYIRDLGKALQKRGIATESTWPWRPDRVNTKPNRTADKAAARWKLGPYYHIDFYTPGVDPVEQMMSAIASNHPIILGFLCYSNMWTPEVDRTGVIPMPGPNDVMEGGHAVPVATYDRRERLFRFPNSWGKGWGQGGWGYLHFDMVRYDLMGDITVLTREATAAEASLVA